MKKVLTIVHNLKKGGTQRAAQNFALGYKELGHNSKILPLYEYGHRYEELRNEIQIFELINDSVLDDIVEWQPDILHIHSHGPKKEDIFELINFLNNNEVCPKVVETNVFSKPSPWEIKLDASFQLSEWCQWLYEKRGGDSSKSTILPYSVVTKNFKPARKESVREFRKRYEIPNNAFVIGRIGQSITTKWCYTIFDVFEGVSSCNKNVYLLLINPPRKIVELFNKSAYKENLVVIDVIYGDDNLSIAYSSMDVFYHSAEQGESFGLVIAESILCGTPVISLSTPWGDNSQIEVVNNGIGGFVVHRPQAAIEIINRLIKKELLYDSQNGVNHIKTQYDYPNVCEKALKIAFKARHDEKITSQQLWNILKLSYDEPRRFDLILLKLQLRQVIRITSGYNSIFDFTKKIINRLR
mgnify:CR=1 FL=1